MLVVDASVAVADCHTPMGFARLRGHELVAPSLMLIKASSVLHEMTWRKEITAPRSKMMLDRLLKAPRSDPNARRSDRGLLARR
jgi:hypothetical protein